MSTQQPKKRKPRTKRMYFGPEVDFSIVKYNNTTSDAERSLIYAREIRPAFDKLAENIIHTFKFYYTDDQTLKQVQQEVVGFLAEKLGKFKQANGKAFSYFSTVAKHYCIVKNKSNYKKLLAHARIDVSEDMDIEDDSYNDFDSGALMAGFVKAYVQYWDDNLETVFTKANDRLLAGAVVELFRKCDKIEIFNKKALYIYIREMTDASTQQITRITKIMKEMYKKMLSDYIKYNKLVDNKIY